MIITFNLYDSAGQPLSGEAPVFQTYVDAITGTSTSAPSIVSLPFGAYKFDATTAGNGVAFMIDCGPNSAVSFMGGGAGDNGIVVFSLFNNDGTPAAAATVNMDSYIDTDGNQMTSPHITNLGGGLYSFLPTSDDVSRRVTYLISTDANPNFLSGQLESSGAGGLRVSGATSAAGQVDVAFSDGVVLTGDAANPSNWTISSGSRTLTITSMTVIGSTVRLFTSEQSSSLTYTVRIPNGVISSLTGYPNSGPFSVNFTGTTTANPTVLMTRPIDVRHVEAIFSEAVDELTALNINNYSADNGLTIVSAVKMSPSIYRLTTSKQTAGVTYTITFNNIKDIAGNSI